MKLRLFAAFLAMIWPAAAMGFPSAVVLKIGGPATSALGIVGRVVGEHLGKHLPGQPAVDVEAVDGAFGAQLLRQFSLTEAGDGSVLGMFLLSGIQRYVTDPSSYDFRPAGLQWIGSLANSVAFCVKKSGSDVRLADAGINLGALTRGSAFHAFAGFARRAGNLDANIIVGFKSENELAAALDRGEIDAYCGVTYSTYERQGRAATQTILGGFGSAERLSELGIDDLSASLTVAERQALELTTVGYTHLFSFALPAGTDPATVAAYRDAFATMNQDPAFIDAIRRDVAEYAPSTGAEVQTAVDRLLSNDPAIVELYADIIE